MSDNHQVFNGGFFVYECDTGKIDGFYKEEKTAVDMARFWRGLKNGNGEYFVAKVCEKPDGATIPRNMRLCPWVKQNDDGE